MRKYICIRITNCLKNKLEEKGREVWLSHKLLVESEADQCQGWNPGPKGTGITPTTFGMGIRPRTMGREWYPGMLGRESNPRPFFSKQPGPMGLGMDLWEGDKTKNLFGTGSRNRTQEPRDGTYRAILSLQDMVSRRSPCSTPSQVWMVLLDLTGMVPSPDSILVLSWPRAFLLGWRSPWSGHTATAS